jgi:hypothetical protein
VGAAREQMAAGKWAAAIALFDRAIAVTIDPTLKRDRGICHDKLDEPFPAMDDYRDYLTARPNAPDAGRIAERLSELQEATGTAAGRIPQTESPGATSAAAASDKERAEKPKNQDTSEFADKESKEAKKEPEKPAEASSSASASTEDGSASGSIQLDTSGGRPANYDQARSSEKAMIDASESPLRRGTGFIIAPFFDLRWNTNSGGDPLYGFGVSPRYSLSSMFTLGLDLGYVGTGTIGSASAASGPRATIFGEARIPLNPTVSDAIIVSAGGGYERYNQANTRAVLHAPLIRVKAGYRHVFGRSVALELGGIGDVVFFSLDNVPVGATASSQTDVMIGGFAGLCVGF